MSLTATAQPLSSSLSRPFPPSVRASLLAAVAEAAVVGGMFACLEAWIVPLLQGRLGASAAMIGVLAMLPQVASSIFGPVSGRIIRALGGPRTVAIHHCWVQVCGFALLEVPLALAADGHPPAWAAPFALVLVALMNGVGAVLGGPSWMAYFGGLVPHRVMGRYTGHRNRVFHVSRLSFALAFMLIMEAFPITTTVLGLQIVLALAMVSRFLSVVMQLRQMEVPHRPSAALGHSAPHRGEHEGFLHFVRNLTVTPFGRFTLVWSLFQGGLMVAGPYYATYLVAQHAQGGLALGGQALLYSTLVYANTMMRLVCLPSAGRLVDRLGSATILRRALLLMAFIPVGWIASTVSGSPWPILMTEILSGFAWALADAAVGPQLFRCHPDPQERAHLIAWHSTVFNGCCLAGTGLGMVLLAFPVPGCNPYLVLFSASLLLRIPAVVLAHRFIVPASDAVAMPTWRMIPGVEASMAFGRHLVGRWYGPDEPPKGPSASV